MKSENVHIDSWSMKMYILTDLSMKMCIVRLKKILHYDIKFNGFGCFR